MLERGVRNEKFRAGEVRKLLCGIFGMIASGVRPIRPAIGSVFERLDTYLTALRVAVNQPLEYTITISALSIEFEASQALNQSWAVPVATG